MGNFLGLFSLISENSGIGINTDILEAGLINIIILVGGVLFLGRDFLSSALGSRREFILASIQEAEDNLSIAKSRLEEAEKQLNQAQILISQVTKEAELTAQKVQETILKQGKTDIEKIVASSKSSILSAEIQIKQQVQTYVTGLVLKRVTSQLEKQVTLSVQAQIIDNEISCLGGQL